MTINYSKYRILIINGQSINNSNATAITLRNLFKNIPKENLMELCFANSSNAYLAINSQVFPQRTNILRSLFIKFLNKNNIRDSFNKTIEEDKLSGQYVKANRKVQLKEFIISYLDACPIMFDKKIIKIAKEFKPDIIYTLGGSIMVLKIALRFSEYCNCGILLHFMDNWRDSKYNSCLLFYPRIKLKDLIYEVEHKSKSGLVISDKMAKEYSSKSGINYYGLMNPADVSNKYNTQIKNSDNKIKIIYTGGLHLNRYKSLLDVEKVIQNSLELKNKCILHIYTSENDQYLSGLFDNSVTLFHKYVPHDKINDIYNSADILLHIESFDNEQISFVKYSLSTKISEYLASGKPIVCYSPKNIAVYEYIEENSAGYSSSDPIDLSQKLLKLINDPRLREYFGANGIETARNKHTTEASLDTLFKAIGENICCTNDKS